MTYFWGQEHFFNIIKSISFKFSFLNTKQLFFLISFNFFSCILEYFKEHNNILMPQNYGVVSNIFATTRLKDPGKSKVCFSKKLALKGQT